MNKTEKCPDCNSDNLTFHKDLDSGYWIECEDCEFKGDITKEKYDA